MKLLINSDDCKINSDLEYIVKPNINIEKFKYCQLLHISTTSKLNNINTYNNKFVLTENLTHESIIELPIDCYTEYLRLASIILITINAQSINKNYIVTFDSNYKEYTIANTNYQSFTISFNNTNLKDTLEFQSNTYYDTSITSDKQVYLYIDNYYLNFDNTLMDYSIIDSNGLSYNCIINIENNDNNILNEYKYGGNNICELNKNYKIFYEIKFIFCDYQKKKFIMTNIF